MMEDRLPLRREKLRFLMESRDIAKSRMHACKNLAPQMLYLLPSLLHEARFPSSEEQKNLQMEAWGCMHLPSAVPGQSETTNEKCSGNENDKKDKTL